MPKQREEVLNAKLGDLLIGQHPLWNERNVHIDSTDTIQGSPNLKIDVLIEGPNAQPVAIETKFDVAGVDKALHKQTKERIGLEVGGTGNTIEAAISVKWPKGLKASGIADARFKYAVYQLGENNCVLRWPEAQSKWLEGGVKDLADSVEVVSLSQKRISEGSEALFYGVSQASHRLLESGTPLDRLGKVLHQEPGEQTTRMAAAIVINAFVFHYAIEGRVGIPPVSSAKGPLGFLYGGVIGNWEKILAVNYWPIFSIARDIVKTLTGKAATRLLDQADEVAAALMNVGATTFHDLAARMFQALIADRKFLATFYTLPESAVLLAELAVDRIQVDWTDESCVKSLKIADFACGTGTLLSAAQSAMYRRVRRSGLDDRELHRHFMENVILGTDIMPSAAHLAASMLSSAHPNIIYHDSLVHVLPYGLDEEFSERSHSDRNRTYIGSLDLRATELSAMNLFAQSGASEEVEIGGQRMTGTGARPLGERRSFPVGHGTYDLVIMNPPFTRPTNHEGELEVPVPSFAGFSTSRDEQRAMSERLKQQKGAIFGHGNAGLASNFMDLAHDKLKEGGVLALVLPFSFVAGEAWSHARKSLSKHYSNITVISIVAAGSTERAFSADTGMAECMVLATKLAGAKSKGSKSGDVEFLNLPRRPSTRLEAHEHSRNSRCRSIVVTGENYFPAGVGDSDLVKSLINLCKGMLQLPRESAGYNLPLVKLERCAERGPVHRDINGKNGRGAFDIHEIRGSGTPSYPALWSHDAKKERQFIVLPDSEGIVRPGYESKAVDTWQKYASKLHHNLDFQLNSQSLALCVTPEPVLGGRAWPSLLPHQDSFEIPLLLWGNSTLGLMLFWWNGTRQQQGRVSLTVSKLPNLPTINVAALTDEQLRKFENTFGELKSKRFRAANEAYCDDSRKLLDKRIFEILEIPNRLLENLDVLRMKWCCEPSVHGGKKTKPPAA